MLKNSVASSSSIKGGRLRRQRSRLKRRAATTTADTRRTVVRVVPKWVTVQFARRSYDDDVCGGWNRVSLDVAEPTHTSADSGGVPGRWAPLIVRGSMPILVDELKGSSPIRIWLDMC